MRANAAGKTWIDVGQKKQPSKWVTLRALRALRALRGAAMAYSHGYLPVVLVLSHQIDADVAYRYRAQRWLILRGFVSGPATASTYSFMRETVGFDLAAFLERNAARLRAEMQVVLETLLSSR